MLTKKIREPQSLYPSSFLYWKNNKSTEKREIKDFLSIGRDEQNMLILDDDFVSRRHARIEKDKNQGTCTLKDMNSQNGLFLNGSRVQKAQLKHNDSIQIGKTRFTFSSERYNQKWKMTSQSQNKKWNETLSRLPHLAQSEAPLLILGPSGTGKEMIAQWIHNNSNRKSEKLVSINCSALTEQLVESELFGHKRGSYTGSTENRKGAFLTASQGSLFLDEIGDLPLTIQPKILRAIEYKEIKPIGSDILLKSNARIISATHQNLKNKVEQEEFRKDLYFRLNVITITIPPLRERMEDFEDLFHYFCLTQGVSFSSASLKLLKSYHWPGNIRELKNTVERAKALFPFETIDREKTLSLLNEMERTHMNEKDPIWLLEKKSILEALKICRGNQSKVSELLEIPRSSLHDKIRNYKINTKKIKGLKELQ